MCKEKKYKWNEDYKSIVIRDVTRDIPECEEKIKFKTWCFDCGLSVNAEILLKSINGGILLSEIHKHDRKSWLDFAIEQGYVKEVESEETFRVGDVVELKGVSVSIHMYNKYIINICASNMVCLNAIDGSRWVNMFSVVDANKITYDEIYQNIERHFKKVGHGAKDLI